MEKSLTNRIFFGCYETKSHAFLCFCYLQNYNNATPPSLPPFLRMQRPGMMPPGGPRSPRFPGGPPPRSPFRPGFLRGPPGSRPPFPMRPGGGPPPHLIRASSRKSSLVTSDNEGMASPSRPPFLDHPMGGHPRFRRPSFHSPQSPPTWSPTRTGTYNSHKGEEHAAVQDGAAPPDTMYDHKKPGGLADLEEEYVWEGGNATAVTSAGAIEASSLNLNVASASFDGSYQSPPVQVPPSEGPLITHQIDHNTSSLLHQSSSPTTSDPLLQLHNDSGSKMSSVKRKSFISDLSLLFV